MALIEAKASGKEVEVPETPEPEETPDLLAALEASLAGKKPRRRQPAKPGPKRRAPARSRARSR